MFGDPLAAHRAKIPIAVGPLPGPSEDEHGSGNDGEDAYPDADHATLTFSPRGPLGP